MSIQTVNPATGELIETYHQMSSFEVKKIIEQVHATQINWCSSAFVQRKTQLLKLRDLLKARHEEFSQIITTEMGKPITSSRAEVDKCILLCDYYAEHAEQYLSPREIKTDYQKSYVSYEPIGIVLAIMPWNFPLWQAMRFLVPTLMTGNAALLSHAPISTGCALMLEKLVADAGYPENLFRSVIVSNEVAAEIIANPQVNGVTLTGSERAGKAVASEAGQALKKVMLELGGSDPYIILEDANLELAAEICVKSRLGNAGQVCIAAKRLITLPKIREQFLKLVFEKSQAYKMGNPQDPNCNFGPMARADLRDNLHQQVQACLEQGAELVCGGEIPEGPGFYYPVTILKNIKPGMPAYEDELFGPVICFIDADDEEQAIDIANSVRFGLGAAVFTQDLSKGEDIARKKLIAGTTCVNAMVASNPALPFGGAKMSGYGRELSMEGIHEFVNVKTICISA
jgi:succinate-semialdehyde dehydrogenase/glutarate-semialdehyde dehydrogenase